MKKEDPYLMELDDMDELGEAAPTQEENTEEGAEATRIDLEGAAPAEQYGDLGEGEEGKPLTREILNLSPDVPVQVVVVMGRKSIHLKDLLGMKMGQVIDLERLPTEPVDLVAGGQVIGRGELVDVDGRLGVRILKIVK